jgi:excisionase family DNA binding protein
MPPQQHIAGDRFLGNEVLTVMEDHFGNEATMKLLTVKEAAEQLGISATLIYALCAGKRIRHERHGLGRGTIRIAEDALEEYRRSKTVPVRGEAVAALPALHVQLKHMKL